MKKLSPRRSGFVSSLVIALSIAAGWSVSSLAAGPSADLDQCRNGSATAPNNCEALGGGIGWVNGNVGSSGAHFLEGYSIPYRVVMKDLPVNTSITLTLGYDITHSGKHALDFLTHFNRLQPHAQFGHAAESISPLSGISGVSATIGTFAIPAPISPATPPCASPALGQPTTRFNSLPAGERLMTLYGGTISAIAYVTEGCLTDSQAETQIAVTFTVNSATAVLAFGGHIASRADWGNGNSAGNISGSPYHMRLIGWSLGNLGNSDRSLSAGAVLDLCSGVVCGQDACGTSVCNVNTGQCEVSTVKDNTTLCREAAGVCDVAEYCDGLHTYCPNDTKIPQGTVCRNTAGVCDVAEVCNGTSNDCPADGFRQNTFQCRASAGVCDVAEFCSGSSAACPDDGLRPSGFECRASVGVCDVAETCTGTSAACPADQFAGTNTVCRASAGVCDVAETCTGNSAACPADQLAGNTTVCRAAAGVCDVAETCTGNSITCPADGFKPSTVECRASAGICDVAESCTGTSAACPADGFKPSTVECRASAGVCDVAESCSGSSAACPANRFVSAGTVCRSAAGVCDVAESCTGNSAACPADAKRSASTVCRAASGVCDVAETCNGTSNDCPDDGVKIAGTVCRPEAGICDVAERCDGTSKSCPVDEFVLASANKLCRASVAACDVPEYCNGLGVACPADSFAVAGTLCRNGDDLCNPAELCTGNSVFCPGDITFVPNPDTCALSGAGVCRTAGFWGTHAGTEKEKGDKKSSINITQEVIDFHRVGMMAGPLQVCGENIISTKVDDAASALEAVCVSVQGNQRLQLARQLTAAALNCAVSGYQNCENYPRYEGLFAQCNAVCADATQSAAINYCINAVDCLNNGGTFYHAGTVLSNGKTVPAAGFCKTGTCTDYPDMPCNGGDLRFCGVGASCTPDLQNCHDQELCLYIEGERIPGTPCYSETGPAGSTNACNTANKNDCTVIGPGELSCKNDSCDTVDAYGKCVAK
jgi:hypothetical protein